MLDFPANKWPQTNRGRLYLRMGSCKPDPEHIWRKKSATAICGYWLWLWKCSDAFGLGIPRGVCDEHACPRLRATHCKCNVACLLQMPCVGVEAQKVSFGLCQRGLQWNIGPHKDPRVEVLRADFRTWAKDNRKLHKTFDLVTVCRFFCCCKAKTYQTQPVVMLGPHPSPHPSRCVSCLHRERRRIFHWTDLWLALTISKKSVAACLPGGRPPTTCARPTNC